ncbi:TAP42-like protein [Immersiella caudata]|uniref:TAP42-like protein n=1 Tax=Immersiella caudata TaxID=314043 RepID=A0AA39WRN7_9PEZI|nr:TAP42-like protein [Immersiella caudata]
MDDNPTLKELFSSAEEERLAIESARYAPNSPEYHSAASSALQAYQKSLDLISSLSLFSPNETLEDLSTSHLPYLLTHFHVAELTQRLPAPSLSGRKRLLTAARDAYERYLHLNDSYDLLTPQYKKLLERYTDSPLEFVVASTSDPALRRNAKIANLKAEKELRSRLEFLRKRPEYGNGADGGDEEVVRQTHLANLAFNTHMAFQALEGLNREWDVLGEAPEPLLPGAGQEAEEDARRRAAGAGAGAGEKDGYSERLDQPLRRLQSVMGGPLLTKQGKPLQPFTLLGNRQELANGVFRPGHNLPTMTIDEYLEEERRRGGIIEGGGEASGRQPEPDEDNYEKADAETMKAREWDEFKEANHRGSGNTLNRG